jgi:hypothetical protein
MTVTQWGIVYYADDPDRTVFRVIMPEQDDVELDEPPTDHERRFYLKADGTHHSWTSFGTDPARKAVLLKVSIGDPRAVLGARA